ncbi:P protein [Drosophila santomea]|uniref:P protein n=1 Tax=Drosophila santomea TaxID=129105 RepID=UPI0019535784|nr:P protein [Drosophila santomea]
MNPIIRKYRDSTGYVFHIINLTFLLSLWTACTIILFVHKPAEISKSMVTVLPNRTTFRNVKLKQDAVGIQLNGAINTYLTNHRVRTSNFSAVGVRLEWRDHGMNRSLLRTGMWMVYMYMDKKKYLQVQRVFQFSISGWHHERSLIQRSLQTDRNLLNSSYDWVFAQTVISFESMSKHPVGLLLTVDNTPLDPGMSVVYAAILIIGLYAMIIWDFSDRTLCTLLITALSLALLAVLGSRPDLETIVSWVDWETMMILLGNMIMTSCMADTGLFDYLAVVAYRISKGHAWLLIALLGVLVSMASTFVDNATVVLLFCPPVIRLCEAMGLRTTLVLIIVAIYANIGGSITPIGGPPNTIIMTNKMVESAGMNFVRFSFLMLPTAVICLASTFGLIYWTMGKKIYVLDDNQVELAAKRRENIRPSFDIQLRIAELRRQPRSRVLPPAEGYFTILATLEASNWVRKKMLLVQSFLALGFAVFCFILQSIPWAIPGASLGWISMLAAFLLLILIDQKNLAKVMARVDWGTLMLLASLFVLTAVVDALGLIHWIGLMVVSLIVRVDESYQTMVGMLLILWLSSLLSAFIHNAAVAPIMVKLCTDMVVHDEVQIRLLPLIWATSMGTSYGANGTLLGSLANEFVAVVGRAHGYKITFRGFFVVGFRIMIFTVVVCSIFLIIAHSIFAWH